MTHRTSGHETDGQPSEPRGVRPDHPRRRLALEYLSARDSSIVLDELAVVVAARESERIADDRAAIDDVAAALHHVHLPKLADDGLVEYDAERRVVAPAVVTVRGPRSAPPDDGA